MALTPILGITQVATNQSSKETTINDAILALEGAGNGTFTLDYTDVSTGAYALSETDFSRNFLFKAVNAPSDRPEITLALPQTLNDNAIQRIFVVSNQSGGELTVTITGAAAGTTGATGIALASGISRLLAMDGDDIYSASDSTNTSRFLDLTDAPGTYSGKAGLTFRVNAAEDALEYADAIALSELSDVTEGTLSDGMVLRYNGSTSKWVATALTLVSTFLGLSDTPSSFSGKSGYVVSVNSAESAVEFLDPASLGGPVTGGGDTGQVLTKKSATDGDYDWADPHMLPNGGTAGQYLKKNTGDDYDAGWADFPANELPSAGYSGQVLAKSSDADAAVEWADPAQLVKRYTPAVVNAVAVSLISGDAITLPWTPTVGNALVVVYFSSTAITTSPSWSVLATAAASGSVWAGGVALGKLVQTGDTAKIQPVTANAADAAIIYELDARYLSGGLTSLAVKLGYSDTTLPQITVAQTSAIIAGAVQRIGNHPTFTVSGATAETVASQDSTAGGNRYAGGVYVDPTSGAAQVTIAYSLNGGDSGAYFYIAMNSIDAAFDEAPVNYKTYQRRNKAWVQAPYHALVLPVGDETTAITTGTSKVTYRLPYAFTLAKVKASLTTASTANVVTIDVKAGGVSVFSTKLTIDASSKTSVGAASAAVLATTSFADDAEITVDITAAGTGAKGLKVYLVGTPSV